MPDFTCTILIQKQKISLNWALEFNTFFESINSNIISYQLYDIKYLFYFFIWYVYGMKYLILVFSRFLYCASVIYSSSVKKIFLLQILELNTWFWLEHRYKWHALSFWVAESHLWWFDKKKHALWYYFKEQTF